MTTTREMIQQIRDVIARCDATEYDVYHALCNEASGWAMRLEELEDDDEGIS